jgi:hypothetical protein
VSKTTLVPALLLIAALPTAAGDRPAAPSFDQQGPVAADEGHTTLSWSPGGAGGLVRDYQLEESQTAEFADARVRYEGPDRASFISGLTEGETWFRVRASNGEGRFGPWSRPVSVEVRYPERPMVLRRLAVGALLFVATVGAVLLGHRRHLAGDA